ncbi:MAG TPA: bacteriohopanetetrol glucosamine biosynthesis glycosyltransferase HpnI [Bryobacterales bacterium]|nr:bacteriohopanetetrol glucosamine biosynthesis glycosyltransferase HpnI [Bryobacterales bacterium]
MTVFYWAACAACLAVAAGGVVFYALVLIAARRFEREGASAAAGFTPPITVLKPLAGLERDLESNLRTFFEQDYPEYQLLFAVREPDDPAAEVARGLLAQYPARDAEVIVSGEPQFPNAKVQSLLRMAERARYDILVISDSDIRVTPGHLRAIAADFADPKVAVSCCPYRAVPGGSSLWSLLEALTLNTEFWCGVLVARMLEGVKFAVGPTMSLRRQYLDRIGGFAAVGEYLAEDFVLGQWAEGQGYRAVLSRHVVEHHIGSQRFGANWKHRIRWARSTRRSRPWGYVGQVFTNPLPFALPLLAGPAAPLGAAVLLLRAAVMAAVAGRLLRDPLTRRYWWLVPLADIASLVNWVLGLFGSTVEWRGRRYELFADGRFRRAV